MQNQMNDPHRYDDIIHLPITYPQCILPWMLLTVRPSFHRLPP